jgi:hypothetical protein
MIEGTHTSATATAGQRGRVRRRNVVTASIGKPISQVSITCSVPFPTGGPPSG